MTLEVSDCMIGGAPGFEHMLYQILYGHYIVTSCSSVSECDPIT